MPQSRVVVVVGASSGMGRATAQLLAEQGASLVLASRSLDTLTVAAQECRGRGAADVVVAPTDIRDADAVDRLLDAAVERFGRVDGVVLTASVLAYGRFDDVPREVFDHVLDTNVRGTANVARSALRVLREQDRGSLVVLGSVLGKMTAPSMSSYATGKWAVHALLRTLQVETRGTGVEVSLVSPGSVNTPIFGLAGSYTGRSAKPPPPVVQPEAAARRIVALLDRPRRDLDLGLSNRWMVLGFRLVPSLFDVLVGPLASRLTQGRDELVPGPGNVLEPDPVHEAVHGRWLRWWGGGGRRG
jgi:NAD(P)-dependent dehydrogenase (short-subunit alcohol dehydrogenase family)